MTDNLTGTGSKKEKVRAMFNRIAPRYDFLNRLLSARRDVVWRRKVIRLLEPYHPLSILDVATGTADLAIEAARLNPRTITGVDIAADMLELGRKKIAARKLDMIRLETADAENLPFPDRSFDAVTAAFGIRNFGDLEKGLREMHRVLKTGGVAAILEFSMPSAQPFRGIYRLYFTRILPWVGRLFSGDPGAYTYLPDSVSAFPDGKAFRKIMESAGFSRVTSQTMSLGIVTVYTGLRGNE
ncbi:MAG: bifunctional demethylmenaquinone methyltransferase/2-methoxy-6-polyprenyl-1,4-benzoquinol methylase UbiE [Bacteroidales bacterium]|nr:bifunctional demethylmenaquinone methyltransferase/2-methoxy-6-polyprenyl-1,4-benzoquinol methylase UbiE [Bacteroidales bacterium]